jgi:hypothetical protein
MSTSWNPLHRADFNGYALRTYLAMRFLLTMDGVRVGEADAWREGAETWRVLRAYSPISIETHSQMICSPSCSSMYSRIISSVMVPELTPRFPLAQKCRPQNFLRKWGNSCSSTRELIPQPLHDPAHPLVGPIRHKQVYVVICDLSGNDFQFVFCGNLPQQVAYTKCRLPCQHCFAKSPDPLEVHFEIGFRVRSQPVMSHATTLDQSCFA